MAINPLLKASRKSAAPDGSEFSPGLLTRIGGAGLSGLARIGNTLDVPGAILRNTIAGENPLAPLRHPTTDEGRVSGRDLLRHSGLIGESDTWGNWAGGLAAEIALDPTTYLTFGAGALTKAGKVAHAAGLLGDTARLTGKGSRVAKMTTGLGHLASLTDDAGRSALHEAAAKAGTSVADLSQEPLQSFAKLGIPFTDVGVHLGTGEVAQKAAGYLDAAGGLLKQTAPVRYARGLFDPSVMGKFDAAEQLVAEEAHRVKQAGQRQARLVASDYVGKLREVHQTFKEEFGDSLSASVGHDAESQVKHIFDRIVRMTGETGGNIEAAMREVAPDLPAPSAGLRDSVKQIAADMQNVNKTVHASIEDKGGLTGWVANHVPRYVSENVFGKQKKIQGNRLLPTMHSGMQARTTEIRDVPAEIVNKLLKDKAARGEGSVAHITKSYGEFLNPKYGETLDKAGAVEKAGSIDQHAAELADWITGHKRADLFDRLTPDDFLKYQTGAQVVDKSLEAIHNVVKQNLGSEGVSLASAYRKAWANPEKATAYLSKITGMSVEELANKRIPQDVADAISGVLDTYQKPAWMERMGQVIDKANAVFKQNVTLPFPSFWARNFTSGQFLNMSTGLMKGPKDLAEYGDAFGKAMHAYRTGDSKVLQELFVEGVIDNRMLSEGVESLGGGLGWDLTPSNPFNVGESFDFARQQVEAAPSKIGALNTARTGYGAVLRTGEKASAAIEFANRASLYLYLKGKGWSPAQAAAKVRQLQVDYSELAPFERDAMKRLVPFYSWQRRIAPVIAQTLLERPGGAMAQTIRGTTEASGADATTPPYIASTLAVPNPFKTPEPGGDSFLTGFGLPFEQAAQYAEGPRAAGREMLSQLTPYLKAPLEFVTNQSFFQTGPGGVGRPIDDLNPTIGQTLANLTGQQKPVPTPSILEFAAANSPAARFLTTARQITDPRKSWIDTGVNALTGVRVTDVSPAAKDRALMDQAAQTMKQLGAREFTETYIPKDRLDAMPAQQRELADKLNQLKAVLESRRKQRKKNALELADSR